MIGRCSSRSPRKLARRSLAAAALGVALLGGLAAGRAETPQTGCDAAAPAATPAAAQPTVQVTVEKVRSSKGLITAVLYPDNPESFLKKGARLDRIRVDAREGETTLCLHAPAAGRYSVALYHDENGNKEFDQDFLGIPTEGYGFSQNPGFRFGKPDIEETLFDIEGAPVSLRIAMLYLH
jgi:uncharacterized protein (DUF2141 family)